MNKKIVVSGVAIMSFGLIRAFKMNKNPNRVIQGSLVLMLLLALMDAISDDLGKVAGALAILALIAVSISELPDLLGNVW